MTSTEIRPISEKQIKFILSLAGNRAWDQHPSEKWRNWFAYHINGVENGNSELSGGYHGTASKFIAELLKLPKREKATNSAPETVTVSISDKPVELVPVGVYNYEGNLYAVKPSKNNPDRRYAYSIRLDDELKKFSHEYAKGLIYKLTPEMRVDPNTVVGMNLATVHTDGNGKRVGSCCVCARKLTRKESIERGIGPICAEKVGY